jgi:hypothetical protein
LVHLAGAALHITTAFALIAGTILVLRAGECVLDAAGIGLLMARLPVAFCIGVATVSLAMLPIVWFANVTAATAFVLVSIVVIIVALVVPTRPGAEASAAEWVDVFVVLTFSALVCWFCRGIAMALPHLYDMGTLSAWADYYIHAGEIAKFGDPLAVGPSDIAMYGAPRAFYHYGIFMLPATLVSLTGLPGLGLATAALLPIGLLVGCLGTYALAAELSGRRVGMFATLVVVCLPDASHYWLKNGFFGFHWLLFTAPGSAYAIGIGSVALALALRWLSRRSGKGAVFLAACMTAALVMIRAHMFILEAPALAGMIALAAWPNLRARLILSGALTVVAIVVVLTLDVRAHDFWLNYSQAQQFLDTIHENMGPTAYGGFYASVLTHYGRTVATVVGLTLVTVASLGVFVFIYALVSVVLARRNAYQVGDAFPILMLVTFVLLILFSPVAYNGDATEYKQRHFVLLYSIFGVYSVCLFARVFSKRALWHSERWLRTTSIAFALVAFGCAVVARHVDPARPAFASGAALYEASADREMLGAAQYIRLHSTVGDTFAIGGADARQWLFDSATIITSLTDLPTYLSRSAFQLKLRGVSAGIAAQRIAEIEEIDRAATFDDAKRLLRDAHVAWYVIPQRQAAKWDPRGEYASFENAGVFVYHVPARNP